MNKKIIDNYLSIAVVFSCLLLFSWRSYQIFTFRQYEPMDGIFSVAFVMLPFCIIFAVTKKWLKALTVSLGLSAYLIVINIIKYRYYKEYLHVSDFYVMKDASNWEILLHYPLIGAIIVCGLFFMIYLILSNNHKICSNPVIHIFSGVFGVIILILAYITYSDKHVLEQWKTEMIKRPHAVFTNLVFSSKLNEYAIPNFSDDNKTFSKKREAFGFLKSQSHDETTKPDIVVWLQESTVNPQGYNLPKAEIPSYSMFSPNSYTRESGLMRVHTFGGGTWLTEFALLSGLDSTDFGEFKQIVFYSVTQHLKTSLVKVLKANGYTTIVLTPANKTLYNAYTSYKNFGIDTVLHPSELGYPSRPNEILYDIPSQEMANLAKRIISQSAKPVFLFMLSIKEHGPYDSEHPVKYGLDRYTDDKGFAGRISDYVDLIGDLNKANQDFSSYLMSRSRPTVFLSFGDHQGNFEHAIDYTFPSNLERPDYITQFSLSTNFLNKSFKPENAEITDVSFLPGLIIEYSNLEPDAHFSANIQMRHLCAARLEDCPDKDLVNGYKHHLYNQLHTAGE